VTVGLEMGGVDVVRPIVAAVGSRHPSLVDDTHRMDALFGVDNIPQNVWIDETGTIVRPPHPGTPAPTPTEDPMAQLAYSFMTGDDPEAYSNQVRDWAANGADSRWALGPEDVIAQSHPRSLAVSEAAACFELAQHRWRQEGFNEQVLAWFARAHTLQPENITYKRQAYSAWSYAKQPDEMARFNQIPTPGHEDEWPFVSDFMADMTAYMPEIANALKGTGR
jgi:hypothetical protein